MYFCWCFVFVASKKLLTFGHNGKGVCPRGTLHECDLIYQCNKYYLVNLASLLWPNIYFAKMRIRKNILFNLAMFLCPLKANSKFNYEMYDYILFQRIIISQRIIINDNTKHKNNLVSDHGVI